MRRPPIGSSTTTISATRVEKMPMPPHQHGCVAIGELGDPRAQDALQDREDDDADDEAPPLVPLDLESGQHEVGDDEPDPRRDEIDERAEQERDHTPILALGLRDQES